MKVNVSSKIPTNNVIANKIVDVPDHVCVSCSQCWMYECRAFEMPHSPEERRSREEATMNCLRTRERKGKVTPLSE